MIRRIVEHFLLIVICCFILTAFSNTNALNTAYNRWKTPITKEEMVYLNELQCVEEFISDISPTEKVKVIGQVVEWDQRVKEIGYPRIQFTETGQTLYLVVSSIRQDFAPVQCGSSLFIGLNDELTCNSDLICALK